MTITTILAIYAGALSTYQAIAEIVRRRKAEAPELVIDYFYSDEKSYQSEEENGDKYLNPWEAEPQNQDKPIIIKNVSTSKNAYNVSIDPLEIPEGKAEFVPDIVTCIAAGKRIGFRAKCEDASPLRRNQLIHILRKSYKDSSTDELFGEKSFILTIRYGNGPQRINYKAQCEILFRPWKNQIRTGSHSAKRVKNIHTPKKK
jgi:hypothetical protein